MRTKKITSFVMVILMVVSLGLAYPPTKAYAAGKKVSDAVIGEGLAMTRLVNNVRASFNVAPITYSILLSDYPAMTRAEEISNDFNHLRPNGKTFDDLFNQDTADTSDDIPWYAYGENIADGNNSVEGTYNQWYNSEGHLDNMLNPAFTHMGIGHVNVSSNYKYYWSQLFIGGFNVKSIKIDPNSLPAQVKKGTSLADTGIMALVTMSNASLGTSYLPLFDPGKIIDGYSVSGYNPNIDAVETVTVTYQGKSTSFQITVGNPVQVTLSEIVAQYTGGAKLVGQSVNAAEVSVTAKYSDGSTQPITSGFSVAANQLVEGANSIAVTYEGKSATVTVNATKPATLESIELQYNGGKKYVGDTISASDFVVIGTYSDGSTKVEGGSITVSPTTLTQAGKNRITVTYGGKSAYYDLNCETKVVLSSITVTYIGGQKFENDPISAADFKVIAKYSDNSTKNVTSSITLSTNKLSAGTNDIVVSFGGKTEKIPVNATKLIAQEMIISNKFTVKTEGDTFNGNDFIVKVKFNNGKTVAVDGWAIKDAEKPLKAGKNTVTFVYGTLTQDYVVEVASKPTEAPTQAPTQPPTEAPTQAPTEAPTQAPTQAPTTAEPTTAEISTAEETEESTEADTTEADTTEADTTEEETTEEETTKEVPEKLELKYIGGAKYVGDSITSEDITVYAIYKDGTKVEVTDDVELPDDELKEGDNTIKVTYEGIETVFFVNVAEKPEETTTAPETEATTQAPTEAPTEEITQPQTKGQDTKTAQDGSDDQEIRDLQKLVLIIAAGFILFGFVMFFLGMFVKKKDNKEDEKDEKNAPKSETKGEK
ncbi:MAG: bacterial Ig-like domain-containing protein [Lachnospiraceae bacterium]|nr:bacterial Ig-like domain-containing protein [Lachnospiraceae bacterium]